MRSSGHRGAGDCAKDDYFKKDWAFPEVPANAGMPGLSGKRCCCSGARAVAGVWVWAGGCSLPDVCLSSSTAPGLSIRTPIFFC